jgi:hypothetical protein
VQHTGEIDQARPLDALWLFGAPSRPLEGYAQARIVLAQGGGRAQVSATADIKVEVFGDGADISVEPLT